MAAPWLINEMTARITTTMTARNTPAVVAADAGPRRHPRRTSARTNGRKVAASTTPSTIDTATVGMSVTIWIATAPTKISARSRTPPWGEPIEPAGNEVGRLVFRARIEDREQSTPDSQNDGDQGDRNEEADDPRNRRAGRQRDQDQRRMDADGLAVDQRPRMLPLTTFTIVIPIRSRTTAPMPCVDSVTRMRMVVVMNPPT